MIRRHMTPYSVPAYQPERERLPMRQRRDYDFMALTEPLRGEWEAEQRRLRRRYRLLTRALPIGAVLLALTLLLIGVIL